MLRALAIVAGLLLTVSTPEANAVEIEDPENTLIIELKDGEVVVELMPDIAPNHVERVKRLAREGAYDNVAFHRVIDGFMAQTGDVQFGDLEDDFRPNRAGTGGSSLPDLEAEFSDVPFERGVLGMARSQSPDSANSQFFITFDDASFLNNQYTVFGRVIGGMEHVDTIKRGEQAQNGSVTGTPDRMVSVRVAADR
ncbi:MAG TPA: peptidylprolyl isomerase [Thermohalobaculum sp.]|nr:peptidylprolyl isomerase [Thermohalobaculum sp.]